MVAVQQSSPTETLKTGDRKTSPEELLSRLERGWQLIDDRASRGLPVESYERHWIRLLRQYESSI